MHKLKSAKLWLALMLVVLVSFLNYMGQVGGPEYIDFIKWIFGIYVFGNVTTKAVNIPKRGNHDKFDNNGGF